MKAKLKNDVKIETFTFFGKENENINWKEETFDYEDFDCDESNFDLVIFSDKFESGSLFVYKKDFCFVENPDEAFIFEYNLSYIRKLFMPINAKAKELCKYARRKNLTAEQLEFYAESGYKIEIYPNVDVGDKLKKYVRYGDVCKSK